MFTSRCRPASQRTHCRHGMEPGEGSRTAAQGTTTARRHHDILTSAINATGFIDYPTEWWCWSYGGRYWAFQSDQGTTLYGSSETCG
jgi:D-alanyl-D-alanine dipeptidase